MRKILKNMGFKRIVRVIPTWDLSLQKTAEKKTMKRIAEGGCWNILGFRKYFWTGLIQQRDKRTVFISSKKKS
jgi:hypothetical protein